MGGSWTAGLGACTLLAAGLLIYAAKLVRERACGVMALTVFDRGPAPAPMT